MRQRGAAYAPLPRETITLRLWLTPDIGRAKPRRSTLDFHLEDQALDFQNLHSLLSYLRPQYTRKPNLPP
jgi:hypothetical protein